MITLAFLLDHQVISRSDKNTVVASAAETKLAAYDTLSGAIHEGVNEA